jgi:hypothetical protein
LTIDAAVCRTRAAGLRPADVQVRHAQRDRHEKYAKDRYSELRCYDTCAEIGSHYWDGHRFRSYAIRKNVLR